MSEVHIVEINYLSEGDLVSWKGMPSTVITMRDITKGDQEGSIMLTLLVNSQQENNNQQQSFAISRWEKLRLLRPVVID